MDPATDWVVSGGRGALDFDGSNDRVSLDSSASNFRSLSQGGLSFWFNLRPQTVCAAFHFGQASTASNFFTVFFGNTTGSFPDESVAIARRSGNVETYTAFERKGHSFYFDETWHHFCFVSGGFGHAVYIDGLRVNLSYPFAGSSSSTGFLDLALADVLRIGNRRLSNTEGVFLNGQIDDVRIFRSVLTPGDARQLWQLGRGNMPMARKRRYTEQAAAGFKAHWARRQSQLIGGGV
jgi:hypothetical protein